MLCTKRGMSVQDLLVWVPQLNAERLSRLLWGLASLRYYHAPLYNAVAQESASRMDSFRPDHLTSLLLAWATTVGGHNNKYRVFLNGCGHCMSMAKLRIVLMLMTMSIIDTMLIIFDDVGLQPL
jgi:hypothetical protein